MKWHAISSIKHLWDLIGRWAREWNDVNNVVVIECALLKKCNHISMVVAQRLISSMKRRCVGFNRGHTRY